MECINFLEQSSKNKNLSIVHPNLYKFVSPFPKTSYGIYQLNYRLMLYFGMI